MTNERKKQIELEARRRLNLWLRYSSFDEMSCAGSMMRFNMSLALIDGYPFEKLDWMKSKDFKNFVTEKEYYSTHYDEIIETLYNENITKLKENETTN